MNRPAPKASCIIALASAGLAFVAGCGSGSDGAQDQPSYAELVVIYNAEQETLDRLEKKRAELIAEYERQARPNTDEALQSLTDMLNSTAGTGGETESGEPLDPNAALDRAVESAERTQQATAQLLENAMQASQKAEGIDEAADTAYPEELQRELMALDEEIEAQQARVERARRARDAAEAN